MIQRRGLMLGAAAASLPRFAIAAGDDRPSITVAVQVISTSNTLDPLGEQSNVGRRIMNCYLETLIGQNLQGDLESIPRLATSWKRIDFSTVELSLRPGVRFHNGDEMTADDVVFTFGPERMFGTIPPVGAETLKLATANPTQVSKDLPAQIPPVARRLWPSLIRVQPIDKYTVRFINATPDLTMEGRLSSMGSEIISRRAYEEAKAWIDYARAPTGTGPYRVVSFTPDHELVMEAHDAYYGGRPPIKRIRFLQVPEVTQRVNGLRAGDFQFACDLPPDQIKTVEADPKLQVAGGVIPNIRITTFDKFDTALRDPKLRLAMAHAIDRKTIIDTLWLGRTIIPAGLQFPFYGPMFVQGWTVPEYDPAAVKDLLKQANYKGDPIPYRLMNDYYTNQTANAQVLVEMWKQAGINVEIHMMENGSQMWDPAGKRGIHDWSSSAWFNDPVASLIANEGPNGQQQQVGEWHNTEMNELAVKMITATDMKARHDMFARMLMICEREDPAYTVLHQNATFTGKPRSILWKAAPDFAMDFRATNWGGTVNG